MGILLLLCLQAEMSARDVVEWVESHTKHRFIHNAALDLSKVKIRCRKEELDPAKAYEAGLALLKSVGLVPVRKTDARVVEILHSVVVAKSDVPAYDRVEGLPSADEFCTLVMKPKFIGAREARAALINVVGLPQNVMSVEGSGCLLVTYYAPNLRRLARLLADIDKPGPEQILRLAAMDMDWCVKKFLDTRFSPLPPKDVERIPGLLKALGAEDAAERETAERELRALGPNVSPHLATALASDDLETRVRVKAILFAWAKEWVAR